jgi:MFS family permease
MFIQTQRQKIIDLYNDYPPKFWTLLAITFIDRLGGSLLFPFFALYLTKRFDVGMTQVGMLFLVWSLTSFVGSMLGGALTDRFGRKWIVIFSLVSTSFSSVVMGLVGSLQAFFTLALVVGVFTEVGGPAYQAMVADLLPAEKRAQGYGLFRVTFNLSVVIGPAIGGFLAARSYLLLFISDAIISLISAVLVAIYLPETKPEAVEGAQPESMAGTFGGYFQVLRDRVFMLFLLTCMLMVFVYMNMNTTLGVYLRDVHGIPESGYGLILSLNALMVVLFQFPITRRIEGKPQMLMMALGMALYTIGFSMYGLVSIYPLFLLAMVIITIGEMLVAPVSQALTAQLAPEDMRGRYMAVFGISWGLPFAIGPILAGLVMDKLNPTWLWYIAGLIGILATSGFLGLHRLVGKQLATAEAMPAGD